MRDITATFVFSVALVLTPVAAWAQSHDLQEAYNATMAVRAMGTGGDIRQPSELLSYQQLALPYVTEQSLASAGPSVDTPMRDPLRSFRVPGDAPYFADGLIEAAKLGNTSAGIEAMAAASAKVTAAARSAIIGDGFGGNTKKTVSAEIEKYLTAIAKNNPAAAIELSQALARGTGLRDALNPSRAVAAALSRMAAVAQSNLSHPPSAPSTMPPLQELYQRSLAIAEHPDVATSLSNLAALYYALGRYAEARPLYQRALAIMEKTLGPEHPDVATSLNNLAAAYYAMGRHSDAVPFYQRALAINEKAFGPQHPNVATSLDNLAAASYAMGGYAEAPAGAFVRRWPI